VRDLAREPMPGEIRLQWWRDVVGGAHGEARANPVAAALLDTIVRYQLPQATLTDLIDARSFDLYDDPMGSMSELESYAVRTSSGIIELASLILHQEGGAGAAAEQTTAECVRITSLAAHLGIAHAVAGLLASLALHAARGQLYVPIDVLTRHGAATKDIQAGKATPELRAALADMRSHARQHLIQARALIRDVAPAPAVMPALLAAALTRPLLDRMEARGYEPFRPVAIPQWRRQWILWRAARGGLATAL
jgi:phytoene synthase